jgi:hypothetical protein
LAISNASLELSGHSLAVDTLSITEHIPFKILCPTALIGIGGVRWGHFEAIVTHPSPIRLTVETTMHSHCTLIVMCFCIKNATAATISLEPSHMRHHEQEIDAWHQIDFTRKRRCKMVLEGLSHKVTEPLIGTVRAGKCKALAKATSLAFSVAVWGAGLLSNRA